MFGWFGVVVFMLAVSSGLRYSLFSTLINRCNYDRMACISDVTLCGCPAVEIQESRNCDDDLQTAKHFLKFLLKQLVS